MSVPQRATRRRPELVADVCLGAGIAALALIRYPYQGITGDARLYVGRALADLDPAHVGRDLMFRLDGQSDFTLFRPVSRWCVAHLGIEMAVVALTLGAFLAYALALFCCAKSLVSGRRMAIVLSAALLLPRDYTPFGIIHSGEALAIPRPFSEALVLLSLSCLAGNRAIAAVLLLGMAAALHPIMALPGALLIASILVTRDRRWIAVGACGLVLASLVAAPLLGRVFSRLDPTWLDILRLRNSYLFVSHWPLETWSRIAVQAVTLILGASAAPPIWRRILFGALAIGALGCFTSFVGADLLSSVLMAQVQLWRSLWLVAALAPLAAGLCLLTFRDEGWKGAAVLATLAVAWTTSFLAPVNAIMAMLALALARSRPASSDARLYKLACAGSCIVAACGLATDIRLAHAYLSVLPADMPVPISNIWQLSFAAALATALVWIAVNTGPRLRLGIAVLLLGTATAALARFDERPGVKADIDAAHLKPDLVAALATRPGEVLWLGGDQLWYWARRPNWSDMLQGAGLVFSRDLAMVWFDRTRALIAHGFGEANLFDPWKADVRHPVHGYDPVAVADFCRRPDAPAWIVMPLEDGLPLPSDSRIAVWESHLDERHVMADGEHLVLRQASRRLLIPCAGTGSPELAQRASR